MEPENRDGLALFGCGRIGALHLKNLSLLNAKLLWVVDIEPFHENIKNLLEKNRFSQTQVVDVSETEEVLSDDRVQGVIICTRVDQHEQLIKTALKADKDVFCEKPLALSTDAIRSCYQLAQKVGRALVCGFQRRYDADFKELYDQIQSDRLGKLQVIKITSRDNPRHHSKDYIRNSGGIFLDSCSHDFDMAIWLAGELPESIVAYGHAFEDVYRECDDVSSTVVMMKFPSGTVATLDNSRLGAEYGYDQRIEVLCTKGMVKVENHRPNRVEIHGGNGTVLSPLVDFFQERYKDAFVKEMSYFIKIVQGTAKNFVKAEEVIAGSVLIEKAKESLKTGKNIKLSELNNNIANGYI